MIVIESWEWVVWNGKFITNAVYKDYDTKGSNVQKGWSKRVKETKSFLLSIEKNMVQFC